MNKRILICVNVLSDRFSAFFSSRIALPKEIREVHDIHWLLVLNSSFQNQKSMILSWIEENKIDSVAVIEYKAELCFQGYEKICFHVAIDQNYDFVMLLTSRQEDNMEILNSISRGLFSSHGDIVVGYPEKRDGRNKRIHRFSFVQNILVKLFNHVTGLQLNSIRYECLATPVAFLKEIPFELNNDDSRFNVQLLLQASYVNAAIIEFPFHPLPEKEERERKPFFEIFFTLLQFMFHQMGMLCSLKYRNLRSSKYNDKARILYTSHMRALDIVRQAAPKKLLDIGCGPGYIAQHCEKMGIEVTGVDCFEPGAHKMTHFYKADLEREPLPVEIDQYDMVLMLDFIEHLRDPEYFLINARKNNKIPLDRKNVPLILITTPNIAYFALRLNLLLGRFTYAERGILDITHKRLFTKKTLINMLKECGYEIEFMKAIGAPFGILMDNPIGRILGFFGFLLAQLWPSLFAFQFLVGCKPRLGVQESVKRMLQYQTINMIK